MFGKGQKDSWTGRRHKGLVLVYATALLLMGMGEKYSEQGHALGKKVYQVLLQEGYCKDMQDCYKKHVLFGEDGDRVNLNIYGLTDRKLISIIFSTVLNEGSEITGGVPITIRVYPRPNREYLGLKSFSKEPTIKMEINQQ